MKATLLLCAFAAAAPFVMAEDLPDGKGKELVAKQCVACHDLEHVTAHRDSKDGWDGVVAYMVSRGMPATNEDITTMVEYLAKSFPTDKKLSGK